MLRHQNYLGKVLENIKHGVKIITKSCQISPHNTYYSSNSSGVYYIMVGLEGGGGQVIHKVCAGAL